MANLNIKSNNDKTIAKIDCKRLCEMCAFYYYMY